MRFLRVILLLASVGLSAHSQTIPTGAFVTIGGTLSVSNGLPSRNSTITFKPTQPTLVAGTGIVLSSSTACYTTQDGSVVGLPDPLSGPVLTPQFGSGSLTAGTYYVRIAWDNSIGNPTLASPEVVVVLNGTGSIQVAPPVSGSPAGASHMRIYVGTTSGGEQLQSSPDPSSVTQIASLVVGIPVSASNGTACQQVANDAMWPTVGYQVSMTDVNGNAYAGFPMTWQLLGPGSTINIGNGLPTWRGAVTYPAGVLQQPTNHALQGISGPLSLQGYNLFNVGRLGIGTATPGYPLDVVGLANVSGGFVFNGGSGVTSGQCLVASSTPPYTFTPGSCTGGLALYYQSMQNGGSGLPQRGTLNVTGGIQAADDSGNNRTTVFLANTGVTPGTYTIPTVTVDATGRVTAISGTSGGTGITTCGSSGCARTAPDGTIEQFGTVTAQFVNQSISNLATISFPTSFSGSAVTSLQINPVGSADGTHGYTHWTVTKSTTGATFYLRCSVDIGGGGCGGSLNTSIPVDWYVIGK